MSALLEKRLTEWATWFHAHNSRHMPIDRRIEFQQKVLDGLLELLAITAKDVQVLERRNGNPEVKELLLPRGILLDEPIRRG